MAVSCGVEVASAVQAVGIDVGYGVTKWVGPLGHGSAPSVWAAAGQDGAAWGMQGTRRLVVDGMAVCVGAEAEASPDAHRPFGDGRLADPEALPLLGAAIWATGCQGDIVLGSGMPLGRFAQEREESKAALEGRVLRLGDGTHEVRVRIARLALRPQGVGAALSLLARGLLSGDGLGCVIDVGTRTTDVVTLDLGDGHPVMPLCWSSTVGLATAGAALAADAAREVGWSPPLDLCMAALGGRTARWHSRPLPSPAPYLDALAAGVRADVRRHMGSAAGRVSAVALVGGGCVLLGERLHGILGGDVVPLNADEAVRANAEGYRVAAMGA